MVQIELKAVQNNMAHEASEHKHSCFPDQISVEANSQKINRVLSYKDRDEKTTNKLVIFGKEAEEIRERLTNGSRKLDILSIVGMPGIGKTSLADSMFQHSLVIRHFHVQAKCSVSQVFNKVRLLREILKQVTEGSNQFSDDDLEWKLYQSLKGRKYLIFMDDIWDIKPWTDIRNCFPDDENGSRVMFTSRFDVIATQVGSESIIYRLFPLSEDKSWEMLQVKLFGKESCPSELERLGRQIVVNCKGLPLTIDLIAGILLVKETKEWEKVAESITTLVLDDPQGRCRKVLELSYYNLPDELKPCFLYFTAFPGDSDVPLWKLISLWIAEGFVQLQENDPRCLEDAAEDILNNLIARSLIIVSKRRYLGRAKASRVHDLFHEFALAKAQEESFMLKIDGKTIFSTVSSGSYQWQQQYRLSIYPDNWERFHEYPNPSGPRARTLICYSDQVSLNLSDFKLLTVLEITQNILFFSPTMFELIHLRFLAISSYASKIMSNIHKLRNLETFIINLGREMISYVHESLLLDNICNMGRLRHLHFGGYISFVYRTRKVLEIPFMFNNLRTLKSLEASYEEDIESILKLMPNLVELKVLFYNPDGESYTFPKLDFLKKLESLVIIHRYYDQPYPCKIIGFPPYLKKLVLNDFLVPWIEISDIGNFERLEILKLKNGAFQGPIWDMIDGQFPQLMYLCLSNLDIQEWGASEDHLSCLEKLHLEHCKLLEELPSCLAEIGTLQVIKLLDCNSSLENSAMEIKEEQEDAGNDQLVVDVYSWANI